MSDLDWLSCGKCEQKERRSDLIKNKFDDKYVFLCHTCYYEHFKHMIQNIVGEKTIHKMWPLAQEMVEYGMCADEVVTLLNKIVITIKDE